MCKHNGRIAPSLMLLWITACSIAQAADLKDFYPSLPSEAESNVRAFPYGSSFSAPAQLLSRFRSAAGLRTFSTEIADFNYDPFGSTLPALTYKFDPNISIFERSIDSLRPLLSERGQTTGDGKLNSALGYSWIHYDQFQGQGLDNYNLMRDSVAVTPTTENIDSDTLSSDKSGSFRHFRPRLTAANVPGVQRDHWISMHWNSGDLHARCGDLKHHASGTCGGALPRDLAQRGRPGAGSRRLGNWAGVQTSDSEQSSDIGALVLRTKTDFFDGEYGALASRLDFDVPSGDAANQGLGQLAARASLTYSAALGDFSPHAGVGFLWRFDTQQFNAIHFVLGGDVRIGPWLTATTDVLVNQNTAQFNVGKTILSVATGIKVKSWRRAVLSTSLVWRLNAQGLGAPIVPSVAIVYTLR